MNNFEIIKAPREFSEIKAKGELITQFTFRLLKRPENINPIGYDVTLSCNTAEEDREIKKYKGQIEELEENKGLSLIGVESQIENINSNIRAMERMIEEKEVDYPNITFKVGSLTEYKEGSKSKLSFAISTDTAILLLSNIIDLNRYFISLTNSIDGTSNTEVQHLDSNGIVSV